MLYSAETKFFSYKSGLQIPEKEVYSCSSVKEYLEILEGIFLDSVIPFVLEKEREMVMKNGVDYHFRYELYFLFRPSLNFQPHFFEEFLKLLFSRNSFADTKTVNNRFVKRFRENVFSVVQSNLEKYDLNEMSRMFLRLILKRSIYGLHEEIVNGKTVRNKSGNIEKNIPIFRIDSYIKKKPVF